jgi:hypothetical protein
MIQFLSNEIIPEMAANTLLKITGIEDINVLTYRFNWPVDTVHYFEAKGSPVINQSIKSNYVNDA